MPNTNQLEQLEEELKSVLTMLQTIPPEVLIASMRINTILAVAEYDERAAKQAKALLTATAKELGLVDETEAQENKRIEKATKLAQAAEADHQATAAQKQKILAEAKELGLTHEQLAAFDIVTKMIHLDRNIKMAYVKAAGIDQDKIAAEDLVPFWSELSRGCLSKSGIDKEQLTGLLSLTNRFIEYSDKGTQGQHVLSRLEGVLSSENNETNEAKSRGPSKAQEVMSALAQLPAIDDNEQKQVPFSGSVPLASRKIHMLEQRLLAQEGQALIENFWQCMTERKGFVETDKLVNFWQRAKEVANGDEIFSYLPTFQNEDERKRTILALNQLANQLPPTAQSSIYDLSKTMQKHMLYQKTQGLCASMLGIKNDEVKEVAARLSQNLKQTIDQFFESNRKISYSKFQKEMTKAVKDGDRQIASIVMKDKLKLVSGHMERFMNTLKWVSFVIRGRKANDPGFGTDSPMQNYSMYSRKIRKSVGERSVLLSPDKSKPVGGKFSRGGK